MADVVVIGGGVCGLGVAILLARDGHEVTVLERDADPLPESAASAWDTWTRKGVAQYRGGRRRGADGDTGPRPRAAPRPPGLTPLSGAA